MHHVMLTVVEYNPMHTLCSNSATINSGSAEQQAATGNCKFDLSYTEVDVDV